MSPIRYLIMGMLSAMTAIGAPLQFQSSTRQTALVELYTSEGCSSCPPAEAWLSRLKTAPALWSDFVPVAFHVDYWDYLGWRDQWASKQFSDRQRDYAQSWQSENIYTPEFALNGKEWSGWRGSFGGRGDPPARGGEAGVLTVVSQDTNHWQVRFVPALRGGSGYEVHAALLLSGLGADVKSGENAGHHLRHDFVAIALIHQPLVRENDGFTGPISIAAVPNKPEGKLALAAWVTQSGTLAPVQAVGGWLADSEKN